MCMLNIRPQVVLYPAEPPPNSLGAEMYGKEEYLLKQELLDDWTRPQQEKFVK